MQQSVLFLFNTVIDNCQNMPCLNGGSCSNGLNKFTCSCAPGYNGTICQSGKMKMKCLLQQINMYSFKLND